MDTNTLIQAPRRASSRHTSTVRVIALAGVLAMSASAATRTRQAGRRITPNGADQVFLTIWVVDRAVPEFILWQTLVDLTSSSGFQPVVIRSHPSV